MDTLKKLFKFGMTLVILCIPIGVFMLIEVIRKMPKKTVSDTVTVQENVVAILKNQKTGERRTINVQ